MSAPGRNRRVVNNEARDRGRALLIAEEPLELVSATLKRSGMEIVGVSRGTAALISLQRSRPDIVIACTAIRGIRTAELARMLAHTQEGVPLILVGAEDSTVDRRSASFALGAVDYFQLPSEIHLLTARAGQLIELTKLMNRLRAEADLDYLTGLANRRRFRRALAREVERWRRYSVPCALLLLDIDHLKVTNDTYGHAGGDLVIRQIAKTLLAVSRANDTAARLGGEEFALLLAGTSGDKAQLAAERLRTLIAHQPVDGVGIATVSIGVAACPEHANSERTLYTAGDSALYLAKNEGRNRVAVASLMQEKLPGV